MTTQNEARAAIYRAWISDFGSTAPFRLDNEKQIYGTQSTEIPQGSSWARLVVRHTSSNLDSLGPPGGRKFRRDGNVIVSVFTPLDTFTETVDAIVRTARQVFEGKTLTPNTVYFRAVSVNEIGPDGPWFQVNVTAPFHYFETK